MQESDDIKITINDKTDEKIKEPTESLFSWYQYGLDKLMKGSGFSFDCVDWLHCKSYKIIPKREKSNMCSSIWIKTKKETINPVNEDDNKCLQYAATLALDYVEIRKNSGWLSKTIKNYL